MTKFRLVVSLITKDNDYQVEQAASARSAAAELGVDIDIIYGENDGITQSTQLLKLIQAEPSLRPHGLIVEPCGATSLSQVASAAAGAGVGWAIVNREAEYTDGLRKVSRCPVFSISTNQKEIGRIQGKQIVSLLPEGGSVLYIQGPSVSSVAAERFEGLRTALPSSVHLVKLKGKWTEESAYQSVASWMKLMGTQTCRIDLIAAQNDVMAMGAKKALKDCANEADREVLAKIRAMGCDGVPVTGQAWVRNGQLVATVVIPATAGKALTLMTRALEARTPPTAHTIVSAESLPPVESLKPLVLRSKH
jgi:ribose transport system substrate-binding protein